MRGIQPSTSQRTSEKSSLPTCFRSSESMIMHLMEWSATVPTLSLVNTERSSGWEATNTWTFIPSALSYSRSSLEPRLSCAATTGSKSTPLWETVRTISTRIPSNFYTGWSTMATMTPCKPTWTRFLTRLQKLLQCTSDPWTLQFKRWEFSKSVEKDLQTTWRETLSPLRRDGESSLNCLIGLSHQFWLTLKQTQMKNHSRFKMKTVSIMISPFLDLDYPANSHGSRGFVLPILQIPNLTVKYRWRWRSWQRFQHVNLRQDKMSMIARGHAN